MTLDILDFSGPDPIYQRETAAWRWAPEQRASAHDPPPSAQLALMRGETHGEPRHDMPRPHGCPRLLPTAYLALKYPRRARVK